ncbi:MAG: surface-adhesin E family protein [Hyphomonadaceae bacterium]
MKIRFAALAAALLALSACGETSAPQGQSSGGEAAQSGNVSLMAGKTLPDWLLFARSSNGGNVFFNQRTITRTADGAQADMWIQIEHRNIQVYGAEDSEKRTTITFNLERLHYQFKCPEEQFRIVTRQFMGAAEVVAAEQATPDALWRPVPPSGIARVALPVACRGR